MEDVRTGTSRQSGLALLTELPREPRIVTNFRDFDLNLLLVLDGVLREGEGGPECVPCQITKNEVANGLLRGLRGTGLGWAPHAQVRVAIFGLGDPSNFPICRAAHQSSRSRMVMIYLFRSRLDDRIFCFSLTGTCANLPGRFAPWVNLGGSDVRAELEKSLKDDLNTNGFRMIRKRDTNARDAIRFPAPDAIC
jgi:hypothetical protein